MATWSTEFIDNLPDSSFLYIEEGGKKDGEGKTVPRSLRHFPVKDADGKPAPDHVRNALARIPDSNLSPADKAEATAKAEAMLKTIDGGRSEDAGLRDLLIRTSDTFELTRTNDATGMPILHGRGAVYGEWSEINSRIEGHFMERFAPGSFAKTISEQRDQIRCLYHHGLDPSIGTKPLGPIIELAERGDGVHYDVDLLPVDYVRDLVPGLRAGLYGSSHRFGIVRKSDERKGVTNAKGLLERTITEAYMKELGPTPMPQYSGSTAGIRSLTDEFVLGRFPAAELVAQAALRSHDRDIIGEMKELARAFLASSDTDEDAMQGILAGLNEIGTTAPSKDAAHLGTSDRSAAAKSNGLFGLDRDSKEVAQTWRL
jgi:phage head maturation protease